METVYKYSLRCTGSPIVQVIPLPEKAQILTVAVQPGLERDDLFLWAKVNPHNETELRQILVLGTGQSLEVYEQTTERCHDVYEGALIYISTFFMNDRGSVGHAFEVDWLKKGGETIER